MNPVTDAGQKHAGTHLAATTHSASPATRPLRADAVRNQQRILIAARELFASHGLDITLDLVAEHAGVGVGTVYRRFANKQELIAECFSDSVRRLAAQAQLALHNPDPWDGVVQFFGEACEEFAASRGLSEVVRTPDGFDTRMACIHETLEPAVQAVVERARTAGVLRPGVDHGDFYAMIHMLDAVSVFARPVNPTAWHRYFELMLDGLRSDSRPRVPLVTPPLTQYEIEEAKRRMGCFDRKR